MLASISRLLIVLIGVLAAECLYRREGMGRRKHRHPAMPKPRFEIGWPRRVRSSRDKSPAVRLPSSRVAVIFLCIVGAPACRRSEPKAAPAEPDASPSSPAASASAAAPFEPAPSPPEAAFDPEKRLLDAGARFRDAKPRVETDANASLPEACAKAQLDVATVLADPRCAISTARAATLQGRLARDGGSPELRLRTEATLGTAGSVQLRLVNASPHALTLPLRYHAKVPAFSAIAEDERSVLYELEPPTFATESLSRTDHVYIAQIGVAAGSAAVAVLRVLPKVLRRLAPRPAAACADAGVTDGCAPATLPRGRYTLHVSQLLADIETGAPAHVAWTVE
jgi:hypothetical protein